MKFNERERSEEMNYFVVEFASSPFKRESTRKAQVTTSWGVRTPRVRLSGVSGSFPRARMSSFPLPPVYLRRESRLCNSEVAHIKETACVAASDSLAAAAAA